MQDFLPLEPDVFRARALRLPGAGLILQVGPQMGEHTKLVKIAHE